MMKVTHFVLFLSLLTIPAWSQTTGPAPVRTLEKHSYQKLVVYKDESRSRRCGFYLLQLHILEFGVKVQTLDVFAVSDVSAKYRDLFTKQVRTGFNTHRINLIKVLKGRIS